MVTLWSILLLFIGIMINQFTNNEVRLSILVFLFFFLAYFFTKYHFAQWYALLGEVPAAFLIILAILVYFRSDTRGGLVLTGVLFSLASQSKLISILPFITFLGYIAVVQFIMVKTGHWLAVKKIASQIAYITLGFVTPWVLFELWKLITLGFSGYAEIWRIFLPLFTTQGLGVEQLPLLSRLAERNDTLINRFSFFLPALPVFFLIIGLQLRGEKKLLRLYGALVSIVVVYSGYWLVMSIGWARHYLIALILIILILGLPYLSAKLTQRQLALYTLTIFLFSAYAWREPLFPFSQDKVQLFKPTQNTQALLEVSQLLSENLEQRPFLTQWWATAVDIEYIMDTKQNFTGYNDPEVDKDEPFIIAVNSMFLREQDEKFMKLLNQCDLEYFGQYTIGKCRSHYRP